MFVKHIAVDDFEHQGAGYVTQFIAWCELFEMAVGLFHEEAKSIALRQFAEFATVGATQQVVESFPLLGVIIGVFQRLVILGRLCQTAVVLLQPQVDGHKAFGCLAALSVELGGSLRERFAGFGARL